MLASLAVAFALGSPPSTGRVELVSSQKTVQAGRAFMVGVRLEPARGYHTYWVNPGDSGSPTTVEWHLPKGWKASELRWPTPSRISTAGIVSYGYEGPTTLLVLLEAPKSLRGSSVTLEGRVDWLTCTSQMCVPANGKFSLKLPLGAAVEDPTWKPRLEAVENSLPRKVLGAEAYLDGHTVVLELHGITMEKLRSPYFFPLGTGMISHSKTQSFSFAEGSLTGRLPVSEYAVKPPTRLSGVLKALLIDVPITRTGSSDQEKSHA